MKLQNRKLILCFALFLIFIIVFMVVMAPKAIKVVHFARSSLLSLQTIPELQREISEIRRAIPMVNIPVSDKGTLYYGQGGIVVDGTAYFTASNDNNKNPFFPYVVSFHALPPFRKTRTFQFHETYDSSPLCLTTRTGNTLLLAHEYLKERTRAINIKTGNTEWISDAKHPGHYFFGYSYYSHDDGNSIVFGSFNDGLHAIDLASGRDLWHVIKISTGGVTPCVDQKQHWVYYQYDGGLAKIDALTGKIIKEVRVEWPKITISWNTVLIDDINGYYIATIWYGAPERDSAIRVYSTDLELLWEQKSLTAGKKATLTYAQGKLITGTGNGWSEKYFGDKWKRLKAWSIKDGAVAWECDLSDYGFCAIYNVPYFNGYFYAETQDPPGYTSRLFRIDAGSGTIQSILEYRRPIFACAVPIIANGMMFSGDIVSYDGLVVTRLASGSKADWKGPFCDPQTNQNAVPDEKGVTNVEMEEIITK